MKNNKPRYYLPILSDPTEADSDGDGLRDDEDLEPLKVFLNELLEKLKLMEQYIDDYYENQYMIDVVLYKYIPPVSPNSTVAINIIRNLYYGFEKKSYINIEDLKDIITNVKNFKENIIQSIKWNATDGTSFPLIRKYIDEKDSSIIEYFKRYRSGGGNQFIDNNKNKIDFLHLLTTLGGQRHIEIDAGILQYDAIDPNLAGWAGDLQSFIYNLKIETYGKVYDYGDLTKSEKFTEIAYDMFTGAIQVPKNKFSNEDLLSDVDAKNINEIYSENLKLSSALKGYYTKHYKNRFTNFISYYGGKEKFYELVGEYTKGNNPIKHLILIKFANDAAEVQKVKDIYEASYITTDKQGMSIYSLQHPKIITEEESIALRDGFCNWIDLKLKEERNGD